MKEQTQTESESTAAKNSVQKIKVLTEKDLETTPLSCGYTNSVVVQLNFRVSNKLYVDVDERRKKSGYKNVAEYFQQAAREKLYYDELSEKGLR